MKPKDKSDIFDFLKSNKEHLDSFGVQEIGVFESFVKNVQNSNSDIDFLVKFEPEKLSYNNFINLVYFLEDNLNSKVDLITIDSLSPHLGPKILEEVEYSNMLHTDKELLKHILLGCSHK